MKDFYERQNATQTKINMKENCVFKKSVVFGIISCIVLFIITVYLI
jgi:hypothetical protein